MSRLGVYIHIPFCLSKCRYCDFLSFTGKDYDRYRNAVLEEISRTGELCRGIDTVFIGGGTPSVLPPGFIEEILSALAAYGIAAGAEITMEANPATVTRAALEEYFRMGINRLSFGLQSANDRELRFLGRRHSFRDFLENYHAAREAGFRNISVDLIHSLPGQDPQSWRETLARVTALAPEHISAYGLTIEEDTDFGRMLKAGEITETHEAVDRDMYRAACEYLPSRGYERYEISNFGLPSRHNIKYWTRAEYAGLGLGAHSLVDGTRYRNTRAMERYSGVPCEIRRDIKQIPKAEAMWEFMFLGLRMDAGVSRKEFRDKFGAELTEVYGRQLEKHEGLGLLRDEGDRIRLSERGIDVCNVVFAEFML